MIIEQQREERKRSLNQRIFRLWYSIKFDLREYKWKIYNYFRSSQHWLIKKIPRSYQDKVELVPLILFEILIDFVENENGLEDLDYDYTDDIAAGYVNAEQIAESKTRNEELLAAYNFARFEKQLMEAEITRKSHSFDARGFLDCQEIMNQKEQEAMMTIVKYSRYLWT